MFWGLILKSNKKYTQTIEKPFHLSKASLDHASSDDSPVQVMYMHEDSSYLLCTLQKGKVNQCSLDLNFDGDKVCFSTKGNGIVHLTGYLMDDEFNDMDGLDMDGSDADLSDEEESEAATDKELAKVLKKAKALKAASKSSQEEDEDDSDEDEDDSDDEEENGLDESMEAEEGDSDEEDDDEDEDDDEEDDDESEAEEPPKKQAKTENGHAQNGKNGVKKEKPAQNGDKTPKQKENKKEPEAKVIKMQGGLVAQELKVGNGAEAKPGKKVQVYYEGRLKTNNKVFDSAKSGKGFKFGLGKGEVIKGWDLGIAGMKVGGKRRLVIPPGLGYGSKGSPPVIPQNAILVFDVELKNVF